MRTLLIIGMGAGDPEHLTIQAIKAMQRTDVFFVSDKGTAKQDLLHARTAICERYLADQPYRMVQIPDPARDRSAADYRTAVHTWHEQRRELYEQLLAQHLGDDECGAFLVWGDPSLYDSTLRIVEQMAAKGDVSFNYEVIPGISSIQALTARHRITLNQIGEPVQITTGRRLAESGALESDAVVLLDGECAFKQVQDANVDIYWAAYLGTEDEILLSGNLQETASTIERVRAEARERKGWIMDTYLLRRRAPD